MAKVSKIRLGKDKMEQYYSDLWEAISSLDNTQKAKDFFFDILTHTERKMLAKRLQLAIMLAAGRSYGEIKREIHVTDGTIAKVNNRLRTGAKALLGVARAMAREEKKPMPKKLYKSYDIVNPMIDVGEDLAKKAFKRARRTIKLKTIKTR